MLIQHFFQIERNDLDKQKGHKIVSFHHINLSFHL